jgi:hypothetical protein
MDKIAYENFQCISSNNKTKTLIAYQIYLRGYGNVFQPEMHTNCQQP